MICVFNIQILTNNKTSLSFVDKPPQNNKTNNNKTNNNKTNNNKTNNNKTMIMIKTNNIVDYHK